ncbi:MAG: hypothetical protein A3A28_00325 [Candidatus Sungbacteria bacterium RIFCSPLOWO2_01_FULL_47_32]|uniref:Methyltransferase type 11 domain-containing protein n=1 Tax=Candidatus Sungbacteria bacterium RIFCSPHIGHO2_01_FULL_47_32 TaxID=1802264 RepID=A0A1G2K9A3_9BACT|nr:MAG: Methyltransferase type 11 [Parcubacteria group bacterium GW2011_GWA2_47_10]OGZ95121.1 MAG: hypothetical protein A2633_06330 [Candidatus Sungbacteria bacterium RIFCSPHIGHO2_01_FULL_47_32]OGZ98195.1 MAG: hypothetical protein A3D57_03195 [Candidatus Sungbacteria bacterium RIFCSPHIGHO2_02_FULL_46_12]OHA05602.1 MAG: hypothetical protein A3A28_00325 [Candidatus Sungbacteria bacterium RIFCSPLOWO2_01_FULL_47_32]
MINTRCAVCGDSDNFSITYPERTGAEKIGPDVFSARRNVSQKSHYRMVRCKQCGLLRSNPVFSESELAGLYRESKLTYEREIGNLNRTYGYYLRVLENLGVRKERLLEIGCGNGFFLEEAQAKGYKEVYGVEPSSDAVGKAKPAIRPFIRQEMFRDGVFPENFFDVICLFQTLDHLFDPNAVIRAGWKMLKPGGFFLVFNHNELAVSALILKERSPIIDIEHIFLFNLKTVRALFEAEKFSVRKVGGARNYISLSYLTELFPLSPAVKNRLIGFLKFIGMGNISLPLRIGNLYCIAQKPG